MNTPRYASAAAKLIGKHLPRATPSLVERERERSVATIERAIRARTRRRRWVGVGGALAAAAVVVLGIQIVRWPGHPDAASARVLINVSPSGEGAALQAGMQALPLAPRAELQAGQRIETPVDGGAALQFSTGTSVTLAGSSAFRVDSQGAVDHFSLQRGELSAHVAKLSQGQRFIVTTPDAEVEVRGTRFRLSVLNEAGSCGGGTRTRLEVSEGVVEVRAPGAVIAVKAGQYWPADCSVEPSQQQAPVGAGPAAAIPGASSLTPSGAAGKPVNGSAAPARATSAAAASSEAERASALAAPNDLFAEGVARRRQGDVSGALRAYQELLTRFPRSALAENALVERMRLISTGDPAKISEAKRYLARYPRGFAAKEAQALAAEP
jgi:ferric-dicitrate binding protein FerR (iron transport regulator)